MAALAAAFAVLLTAAPALAAEGSIDAIATNDTTTEVLFSVPGLTDSTLVDLASVTATFDDAAVPATAALTSDGTVNVRRTVMLAIDASNSMAKEGRIEAAKAAANAFLDVVPDDVYVGVLTFNNAVTVQQQPSLDRDQTRTIVAGLTTDRGTKMYAGVAEAAASTGTEGARSVLLLTDGADVSGSSISKALTAIDENGVKCDVVSLGEKPDDVNKLRQIAAEGGGQVYEGVTVDELSQVFASEADVLAQQVSVTLDTSALEPGTAGNLVVSLVVAGETYTDSAYVTLGEAPVQTGPSTPVGDKPSTADAGIQVPSWALMAGVLALGLGAFILVLGLNGLLADQEQSLQDRISAYTRRGGPVQQAAAPEGVRAQAVGLAGKALKGSKGFQEVLSAKLESANLSVIPAEWILIHAGIAIGAGLVAVLLSSGNVLYLVVGLVLGSVGPWFFLSQRQAGRIKAFKGQLADTLQLMAGSLSSGMSIQQAADSIVREGADPMAAEFRRALVDARLGVPIEDALDGIAQRMDNRDFSWVVMAIRIQREVGGNLAELLNKVAETIREREYLERQVAALSAEGRLSVWILGGLAPGFLLYLLLANPTYLTPMFTTLLGNLMLGVVAILITVGVLWMRRLVKVEV